MNLIFWLILFSGVIISGCNTPIPEDIARASEELPEKLDYNFHVRPILSDRCFACHGPDKNKIKAGLRLDLEHIAKAELSENPGNHAIVEGKTNQSQLFHRIISEDPERMMPPPESNLSLTARDKAILIRWIDQGAEYKPHWAFIKPQQLALPAVTNKEWPSNEIDYFILEKAEERDLPVGNKAPKETLIRRVTFDLTGLPPTLEEIDNFLADNSENAYERVVDRLLGKTAYGERMAVDWLDLARYADSHGYQDDGMRNMWPYRDWVIEKFNQNLPFDTFVQWQLAGDLLPNPTQEQILATAFNRNHAQSQEGGIVPEEYRVEYVADRTQTFGRAFLGLTVECARCHDHKYDPITQKEYYQLYGFFNSVNESGKIPYTGEASPTVILTDEETDQKLAFIKQKISRQEADLAFPKFQNGFNDWLANLENGADREVRLKGEIGYFNLDQVKKVYNRKDKKDTYQIQNLADRSDPARIAGAVEDHPVLVEGVKGQALEWPGRESSWVDMGKEFAVFERNEQFSLSFYLKILDDVREGPLVGRCAGTHDGDRGYELYLEEDLTLTANLVHVFPDNQIKVSTTEPLEPNRWHHITMSYDGSSRADGVRLYRDGAELKTHIKVDNLVSSIIGYGKERANWVGANFTIGYKLEYVMKGIAVDELRVFDKKLTALEVEKIYGVKDPIGNILEARSPEELDHLMDYYLTNISPDYQDLQQKLIETRGEENEVLSDLPEVMVMKDLPSPRTTFVLNRGQYDAPTDRVEPGTPESIGAFPSDSEGNRLGLANWLIRDDNPVLARVTVNRLWQMIFGKGIVVTSDDFGNQGALPTHPELLDWMAVRFVESGWDTKDFLKLLVTSSTYQQSSILTPETLERDPDNEWYARGVSYRMSAEMIRDNALASSGLLTTKIGGPSVHPYQPPGLWKELATRNETVYVQDHGDSLYRRSLYTIWKRTSPPPSMINFDASTRDFCTVRRQKTSTPLQSLVLLNDPQFVEAARVMAEDLVRIPGLSREDKVVLAFRILTSRSPESVERSLLMDLLDKELTHFSTDTQGAKALVSIGEYPVDEKLKAPEVAAYMVLTSTLMNYDEAVFKR